MRVATGAVSAVAVCRSAELGHATAQDTFMLRNFANQISSGKLNENGRCGR